MAVTGRRRRGARLVVVGLAAVPIGFLLLTYVVPVGVLVDRVLGDAGWNVVTDTLGDTRLARIAAITLAQAVVSTGLALMVGVPAAWVHARLRHRGRRAIWLVGVVPFVLPTVVVAAGFLAVTGADGLGRGDLAAWALVIVAQVAVNVAVVVRTVATRLTTIDPRIEAVARSLGASRTRAAWLSIRAAADAVSGAAVIVFLFCFTSFGLVVVLGGGAVTTVEVEIWYLTTRLFRLDAATVLALAQLGLVALVLWGYERGRRRRSRAPVVIAARRRAPDGWAERVLVVVVVGVQAVLAGVPMVALALRSLRVGDGWGFDHYVALGRTARGTALGISPLEAVGNSVAVGVVAAIVACAVALPAVAIMTRGGRAGRMLDLALLLPLATSAATVGFGIFVAYRRDPIDLRGSWWALPLVEAMIAVPLVVRSVLPTAGSIDPRILDAAAVLGASPRRRFREIVVPLVRPAVLASAALGFAIALGEFGAASFLSRSDRLTAPQVVHRLLGRPGDANVGQAMALGCLLALITAGVFAAIEAGGRGRALEF
jgi:thiamine transport system permease protein